MRGPRRPARELRTAIDCMPLETREAMLEAVGRNPIIVGAYTDREGGVCPMLAAHRNGGRTSFAAFARAWDRYTHAGRAAPRRATEREVRALCSMLEASIEAEAERGGDGALGEAIADHRRAQVTRARREEHAATPLLRVDWKKLFRSEEPAEDYMLSEGRMNCSSGTTQDLEVRSR